MTHRTFEEVWQSLQKLEGTTVRTLVHGCPSRILHFDSTGMTRQRCRSGVSWRSPKEKDWELPTAVPKGVFRQLWDILSERTQCEVPKVREWRTAAACIVGVFELDVVKIKDRPLTLRLNYPNNSEQ